MSLLRLQLVLTTGMLYVLNRLYLNTDNHNNMIMLISYFKDLIRLDDNEAKQTIADIGSLFVKA